MTELDFCRLLLASLGSVMHAIMSNTVQLPGMYATEICNLLILVIFVVLDSEWLSFSCDLQKCNQQGD